MRSGWHRLALVGFMAGSLGLVSCRLPAAVSQAGGWDSTLPVVICAAEVALPARWELVHSAEILESGRVGIREVYRVSRGRVIHLTAGISGEFGEALPLQATPQVAGGFEARLLGVGGGRTWLLVWSGLDRCGQRSVTGIGLRRAGFTRVLRASGVMV